MSLFIDSRYITGIYALGQWFKVMPNTIDVDAYEFCNWMDTEPDEHDWREGATVYMMGAAYDKQEREAPVCGEFGPNSRKSWHNPTGSCGVTFTDAETGERVSFSLLEVKGFKEMRPKR
jgi:hypothetical protein